MQALLASFSVSWSGSSENSTHIHSCSEFGGEPRRTALRSVLAAAVALSLSALARCCDTPTSPPYWTGHDPLINTETWTGSCSFYSFKHISVYFRNQLPSAWSTNTFRLYKRKVLKHVNVIVLYILRNSASRTVSPSPIWRHLQWQKEAHALVSNQPSHNCFICTFKRCIADQKTFCKSIKLIVHNEIIMNMVLS